MWPALNFAILKPMKRFFRKALLLPLFALLLGLLWLLGLPLLRWLRLLLPVPSWLFGLIWLSPSLALALSYTLSGRRLRTVLHRVGECWFGVFLYLTMAFACYAAVLGLLRLIGVPVSAAWRVRGGWLALAAFLLCYAGGVINALHIRVVRRRIELPLASPLTLVLLSDLHLGFFSGRRMLPRISRAVRAQRPDAVLLAGDIFDMDYESLRQPEQKRQVLAGLSANAPIFACGGNHDLLFPDVRTAAFIRGSGIRLLADESCSFRGLTLLGRRDVLDEARRGPEQVYAGLPQDQPLLVLDHSPEAYREAWEHGADLVVSGHTHGGQTFPGNLLQRLLMPFPIYGHHQRDGRHLVVTSGAGFWGPPLRVGVNNEIVRLELAPLPEQDGRQRL